MNLMHNAAIKGASAIIWDKAFSGMCTAHNQFEPVFCYFLFQEIVIDTDIKNVFVKV